MNDYIWFVLDVNPEPWAIGPLGVARTGGKLRPYVGRNAQLHAFQETVKAALEGAPEMEAGKYSIRLIFWRDRAEYETPQARTHRKHEADVTNMQKAFEDALQDVLFKNDKDVIDIHSTLIEQGPGVHGKIVLGIKVVAPLTEEDVYMPTEVRERLAALEAPLPESDNSWPPRGESPY